MTRKLLFLTCIIILSSCTRKTVKEDKYIALIPSPKVLIEEDDFFTIDHTTTIAFPEILNNEGLYLKDLIEESSSFILKQNNEGISARKNCIILEINPGDLDSIEGHSKYSLDIFPKYIHIKGETAEGIMNGLQTLRQLFPTDFHDTSSKGRKWNIPCMIIKDAAKFKHRGMLMDCCRHFFEKETVLKYIDLLALYKMNVLHWHLTEDQAWRIQIDKYPLLTEIGSKRTELDGSEHSGYYTKEDIREIVAYATERHITVIPEIELPGHSQAAIASYPHLSCTGNEIEVANDWGVFKDIYCAGNDSTFVFLEDVLTEVMELFPSEYIHIGGDEAPKSRWEECPKCQKRIQDEHLHSEHELQSYFISRIDSFLTINNRKLIGWDEILEGGLSPNATVQSWRGMEGGIAAANEGHDVIMSPTSHCYFDYDLKSIDLPKVYTFDPIPKELPLDKQHHVLGGECNLWSENIPDERELDRKVFPRMLAMSEVLWAYPEERDYSLFFEKVMSHNEILAYKNVTYGLPAVRLALASSRSKNKPVIEANLNMPDTKLQYRWICNGCDPDLLDYSSPIEITQDGTVEYFVMKEGKIFGETILEKYDYHLGFNAKPKYHSGYSNYYPAGGDFGLIDGRTATLDFRDGKWQGGQEDLIVDFVFDNATECSSVSANFYQYNNAWIFLPTEFEVFYSEDGENWISKGKAYPEEEPELRGKFISNLTIPFETISTKYLRVVAKNIGQVPDWHEAAGSDAWVFVDEIIIE